MSVIPLTLFFSLLLAGLFMFLFAREQKRRRFTSAESDSLLPLADEKPRTVPPPAPEEHGLRARFDRTPPSAPAHNDHDHGDETNHDHHDHATHNHAAGCGCKRGVRPPCAGCLKRPAASATTST